MSVFCTKPKYKQIKIDYIRNDKIISEELLWHKICFNTQINLLKKHKMGYLLPTILVNKSIKEMTLYYSFCISPHLCNQVKYVE